jgi:hypothetical protein
MKKNKMHEYIDQLLADGKYDEAIPLIEKIWEKKAQAEKKIIAGINRQLDALEKRLK